MRAIQQVCRRGTPSRASRSSERGQALVEAALTLPLLFLIFFGIIEFSLVIFSYNTISSAAREGARYGIIHPDDTAGIAAQARNLTTALQCSGAGMTVASSRPSADTVRVDIDCTVPLITQMMVTALGGTGTIPLHASATMQVE